MNERDELVSIVGDGHFKPPAHVTSGPCCMRPEAIEQVSDAILAAGYRKPRTITTAEELDALAHGSIIRDAAGDPLHKGADWWFWGGTGAQILFPATVLWEPK